MKVGFAHDEFGISWKMTEAYPYTNHRAYFADTEFLHGTIHYIPKALKCDKVPFNPIFDYTPYDIFILYLQGGRCQTDVDYMKIIRKKYPDLCIIQWWGEIYRFDHDPEWWMREVYSHEAELFKTIDFLCTPFHAYLSLDKFTNVWNRLGVKVRLLCEPYDLGDMEKSHYKLERELDNGIMTMVHGRSPDISRSLAIMTRLQKKYGIKCFINPYRRTDVGEQLAKFPSLKFEYTSLHENHGNFLSYLSKFYFVFDDYPAYCGSNFQLCASGVGVPTISHIWNTSQYLTIPELSFGVDDLDSWFKGTESLILDEDYYRTIMEKARVNLRKYYSFKAVAGQVKELYEEWMKRK